MIQPNTKAKLATGSIATMAATIIPWICHLNGLEMPPEVAIAVGGAVALIVAHFTPVGESPNDAT